MAKKSTKKDDSKKKKKKIEYCEECGQHVEECEECGCEIVTKRRGLMGAIVYARDHIVVPAGVTLGVWGTWKFFTGGGSSSGGGADSGSAEI